MTIWFTADTHFNHEKIIQLSNRPFQNLEEMHETLISNWNSVVRPGDDVYHLGDFALSWGKKYGGLIDNVLSQLNGQKRLIIGNHDRDEVVKNLRWHSVKTLHEIKVDLGGLHKQRIVMCHYSMRVWNQMHREAWMLFGHSHGNLTVSEGKTIDVGVDVHNYHPISLEEVKQLMNAKPIVTYDHHEIE